MGADQFNNCTTPPTPSATLVSNNCGSSVLSTNGTGSLLWSPGGATTSSVTVTAVGTYTVTQTVNGCVSANATVAAAPIAIPPAPTAGSNSPVCTGGTINLTASSSANYSWTGPNSYTASTQNPSISNADATMAGTYSVTTTVSGCTSPAGTTTVAVNVCSFTFTVKFFIQGYYLGSGKMSPLLKLLNVPGSKATDVDTVVIELHDPSTHDSLYAFRGILQSDGNVSGTLPAAATGSFYIVIKHRNSITTWSNSAVSVSSGGSYDFTTASTQAYNSNMADLGDGKYAIYSGDLTNGTTLGIQDGQVNGLDKKGVKDALSLFKIGVYDVRDITGDSFVDETDYRILLNNVSLNISIQHP